MPVLCSSQAWSVTDVLLVPNDSVPWPLLVGSVLAAAYLSVCAFLHNNSKIWVDIY